MPARFELPVDHPHVAVVTIDRPERANALDPRTLRDLADAWERIAGDPEIRCAVLTGAGDRVFCAGMDLATTIPASQRLARGERVEPEEFEGLRAATPDATFALEEVALGLYPTGHATVLLPRQIAWTHAHELLLTARPIGAARAEEIGLVNRIVSADELLPAALATADAIAGNAPIAVRETRRGVRELLPLSLDDAYRRQEEIGAPLRKTEDAAEATRAFAEKRRPLWRGR
jgi:enoyl-CoA hydratase/carnithine racemase